MVLSCDTYPEQGAGCVLHESFASCVFSLSAWVKQTYVQTYTLRIPSFAQFDTIHVFLEALQGDKTTDYHKKKKERGCPTQLILKREVEWSSMCKCFLLIMRNNL